MILRFFLFCLLLIPCEHVRANETLPVSIAVSEIPYVLSTEPDKVGDYNRLLDRITDIEVFVVPPARAERLFDKGEVDCLFPASTTTMDVPFALIQSETVTEVTAYLFSLKSYQSVEEFLGRAVALRRGFSFGKIRQNYSMKFVELESETRAIQFLLRGRVEAVIGYALDVENAIKELKVQPLYFNPSLPLYTAYEAFVCRDNSRNRDFVERINPIIKAFE